MIAAELARSMTIPALPAVGWFLAFSASSMYSKWNQSISLSVEEGPV
jgi:hypothetical protein